MSARDRILARIGKALGRSDAAQIDTCLATHARGPAPPRLDNPVAHFKERALMLSSDVMEAASMADVPAMLAHHLAERGLPSQGVCWPALADLPWHGAGLDIEARPANDRDLLGVTGAFCAIAETGTLMMLSGPETPPSVSLLPETHVAIVATGRIVASMEDAWDLLRRECKQPPRAVNFISGPSRTADIEQTVTLGAHGPYRVLVVLVGDKTYDL
ncbi:MAG: lactate utilization protein C [Sulfuricella sp.]|nr:lactate utilization protein C [Sulfuricella sp.]